MIRSSNSVAINQTGLLQPQYKIAFNGNFRAVAFRVLP